MDRLTRWSVLAYAVRQGEKGGIPVGHTLLQKLVYLLQNALHIPLAFRFKLHYYGPYSEELWGDLNALAQVGVLSIEPRSDGYGYAITPDVLLDGFLQSTKKEIKGLSGKVDELLTLLGNKGATQLEAIATAHYIRADLKKKGRKAERTTVIRALKGLKPHLDESEINQAWEILEENEWFS